MSWSFVEKYIMSKVEQLNKTRSLLTQALSTALASMPNNRSVQEASSHIRSAIQKIDGVSQDQISYKRKMSQTQFETWWGNVQSGTAKQAVAPMSAEASQMSLKQLNGMIAQEQAKIGEIEAAANKISQSSDDQLLQD